MWPGPENPGLWIAHALLGWVWGSFLNQSIDRAPYRAPCAARELPPVFEGRRPTLLWPHRSVCFACGAGIAWFDNLPVLSYLLLRGRCRACAAAIGLRTVLVELATPAGFAALALWDAAEGGWWLLWDYGIFSWALAAAVRAMEGRRLGVGFLGLGCGIALAVLLRPGVI